MQKLLPIYFISTYKLGTHNCNIFFPWKKNSYLWVLFFIQWTLRGLCIGEYFVKLFKDIISIYPHASLLVSDVYWLNLSGFIIFLAVVWVLQEKTTVRILRYVILFIGTCLSCYSLFVIIVLHLLDGNKLLFYIWFGEFQVWWTACFRYMVCAIPHL